MYSMIAKMFVAGLLDPDLLEATVRLPPRGGKFVAVFRGPEPGKQVWRSTGLRDRKAALALAKRWEIAARRQRAASGGGIRKPTIRVRRGSGEAAAGLLNQREVAAILGISVRAVREIERRAFEKLRRHPSLRRFWREHGKGEVQETFASHVLDGREIAALFDLVRTTLERRALRKALILALTDRVPER